MEEVGYVTPAGSVLIAFWSLDVERRKRRDAGQLDFFELLERERDSGATL